MTNSTPFFFGFLTAADATQAAMTWACRYGIPNAIQATETIYRKLTCEQAQRTYAAITIRTGEFALATAQFVYALALFVYALVKTWVDDTVAESLVTPIEAVTEPDQLQSYEVPDYTSIPIEDLEWNTLRKFASEMHVKGRKKTELLQGLHALGVTHYCQ
jgi:hypothetical protein